MPRLGIVDMIELAVTLVVAAPLALYGASHLFRGSPVVGAICVGGALALLLAEQFLWTLDDVPGNAVERLAERVVDRPRDDD